MTLDQLRAHPSYPFDNFRQDDLSFLLLEMYWAELFRATLLANGEPATNLERWQVQSVPDRQDGNPILHLIDRSMQPARALRVIQRFNSEQLPALALEALAPLGFHGDAYVPFVPDLSGAALDAYWARVDANLIELP